MTQTEIKVYIGRFLFFVLKHLVHKLVKRFNIKLSVLQALVQEVYNREVVEYKDLSKEIK